MKVTEGYIEVPGGKVWYIRMGEQDRTPLLVLHGGPGNTHDPLKAALGAIAAERPIIFYDQLGSGHSDRPEDPSLWRTERFVEELACVREALDLKEVHLLGHSWGTMLAASYLTERRPTGVHSVIFSSPCLSAERWKQDADLFISRMPETVRLAIIENEQQGTTDSEAYRSAMKAYYSKHVCRLDPQPEILGESRARANKDVYMTMWGPSEFCPTGNLRTYDVTLQLPSLSLPSLFMCGHYDEASPAATRYYQSLVPGAELFILAHSAHLGYLEETSEYVKRVRQFLSDVEAE